MNWCCSFFFFSLMVMPTAQFVECTALRKHEAAWYGKALGSKHGQHTAAQAVHCSTPWAPFPLTMM